MRICDILQSTSLARIDAELLLAHTLKSTRASIYAHPEKRLKPKELATYRRYEERRKKCEPTAYIIGQCEWYGRPFVVQKGVLIPRPSTEAIIGVTLDLLERGIEQTLDVDSSIIIMSRCLRSDRKPQVVMDIGTGSGCIAVTLALESDIPAIDAVDSSRAALRIAEKNMYLHDVFQRVRLVESDGIEAIERMTDPFLVVSNPPYIPEGTSLMDDVEYEPKSALFSGINGDNLLHGIVQASLDHPLCAGIVLECMSHHQRTIDAMIGAWKKASV